MSINGRSEDAVPEIPPPMMEVGAGDPEASYRQDDAPTGDDSHTPTPGSNMTDSSGEVTRDVDQVLSTLTSTPKAFTRLVDGQSREALSRPTTDGGWGVVELLPHLRDWEEVHLEWIRSVLQDDTPALEVVDDSLWSIEHDYANESVAEALARFGELRAEVVHVLEALEDADWHRGALHPQAGRITLHQLANRMCDHDVKHLAQARDALP